VNLNYRQTGTDGHGQIDYMEYFIGTAMHLFVRGTILHKL